MSIIFDCGFQTHHYIIFNIILYLYYYYLQLTIVLYRLWIDYEYCYNHNQSIFISTYSLYFLGSYYDIYKKDEI